MTTITDATNDAATNDARGPEAEIGSARRTALNEDWLATIVGLALLALVLTGLLPGWLVP